MKNIKYILIFAVLIASGKLFAQQEPSYSLYKYKMNIVNPAYAGADGETEITLSTRNQWANIKDGPETQVITFTKPVNDKIGLGFSIVNDKLDIISKTDFTVDFSYRLQISESSDLRLGVKAGGYAFKADFLSKGLNDPLFNENISRFNGLFGAGAYLKVDKFFATLSIPNFLNGKRVAKTGDDNFANAVDNTHIFAGAGYEFDFNDNLSFTPSVMGRFVQGAPSSVDYTGTFDFKDKLEIGGSYRTDDSFSALAYVKVVDWIKFGYAYEFTTSDVADYSDGSHEIMLKFNLGGNKKAAKIIEE
jgi:type IX secretion system PorP/SprF family membrane protein